MLVYNLSEYESTRPLLSTTFSSDMCLCCTIWGARGCWQHIIKKACGGSKRCFLDGIARKNHLLSPWPIGAYRSIPFGPALGGAGCFAQDVLFPGFGGRISPLGDLWSWVDRPIWETGEVLFRRAGQGLIICRRSLGSYAELGYRYLILFPQSISSS